MIFRGITFFTPFENGGEINFCTINPLPCTYTGKVEVPDNNGP